MNFNFRKTTPSQREIGSQRNRSPNWNQPSSRNRTTNNMRQNQNRNKSTQQQNNRTKNRADTISAKNQQPARKIYMHTQEFVQTGNENKYRSPNAEKPQNMPNAYLNDYQLISRRNRFSNKIDFKSQEVSNKRKNNQRDSYNFLQKPLHQAQKFIKESSNKIESKQNDSNTRFQKQYQYEKIKDSSNKRKFQQNYAQNAFQNQNIKKKQPSHGIQRQNDQRRPLNEIQHRQDFKKHSNERQHMQKDFIDNLNSVGSDRTQLDTRINKYLSNKTPKKQFTSKNFKEYIVCMNNIPYQQRPAVRQILQLQRLVKYFFYAWIFLAIFAGLISLISEYKGQCPTNAKCFVFLRCNHGYVLNENDNNCMIDPKFAKKGQQICINLIQNLKYQNGYEDLQRKNSENVSQTIEYPISKIYNSLNPENFEMLQEQYYIKYQIQDFLYSRDNQQAYNFKIKVKQDLIVVSQKKYSYYTLFWIYITSTGFFVTLGLLVLISCTCYIYIHQYKMQGKAQLIYLGLYKRLISEKVINISHEMKNLESQYGQITEDLWLKVDKFRNKGQRIGIYTQDFLYWKLL